MKHLIWIASYPKSGSTWLRILLDSVLKHQGSQVNINQIKTASLGIMNRLYFDEFLEFESGELTISETNFYKRKYYLQFGHKIRKDFFIKTHEANLRVGNEEYLIPESVTKLCIYLVRNPLDIVGSIANHYSISFDEAIHLMEDSSYTLFRTKKGITSNIPQVVGDWSLHVSSWINSKDLPLLIVKYEDLLSEPIKTLTKILSKLDQSISMEAIDRAVSNHSFEKLANQEMSYGFREKVVDSDAFFRKGQSGSWKEELSIRQINQVIRSHAHVMSNLGYSYTKT